MLLAVRLNVLTKSFVDLHTSFHEKSTKSENLSNLKDKKERIEFYILCYTDLIFGGGKQMVKALATFSFFKGLSD